MHASEADARHLRGSKGLAKGSILYHPSPPPQEYPESSAPPVCGVMEAIKR